MKEMKEIRDEPSELRATIHPAHHCGENKIELARLALHTDPPARLALLTVLSSKNPWNRCIVRDGRFAPRSLCALCTIGLAELTKASEKMFTSWIAATPRTTCPRPNLDTTIAYRRCRCWCWCRCRLRCLTCRRCWGYRHGCRGVGRFSTRGAILGRCTSGQGAILCRHILRSARLRRGGAHTRCHRQVRVPQI